MAIYRPRRSPWPLAGGLAIVALLIGFGVGYVLFGTRPPDLDAATEVVEERLLEARNLLEIAAIEYREGAPDGEIARQTEYDAAVDAVARARAAIDAVDGPMRSLAPDRAAAIDAGFEDLSAVMEGVASPGAVDEVIAALVDELRSD